MTNIPTQTMEVEGNRGGHAIEEYPSEITPITPITSETTWATTDQESLIKNNTLLQTISSTPIAVAGRLHQRADQWQAIGANALVMNWINNGVELEFVGPVFQDRRQLPCTKDQRQWVFQELERLLLTGAIEEIHSHELETKLCHLSPVFVVSKKGPKKYRLVIDLRGLNSGLRDRPIRFENLTQVGRIAGKGWWMITMDLSQGYHHVTMAPESRKYLGFRFGDRVFRWLVLPFGLKSAPFVFTKTVREMVKYLRKNKVHLVVYLDDFVIMAPTREELLWIRDHCITPTLHRLGWVREPSKGQWDPTQRTEVLGLIVDLIQGKFFIPQVKVNKIKSYTVKVHLKLRLAKRKLASISGYINSVTRAAPILRLYCREIYRLIGHPTTPKGWKEMVEVSAQLKQDMAWIYVNIDRYNGAPMWHQSEVQILQTDASDLAWGGVFQHHKAAGTFSVTEQKYHIMYKEMLAVLLALRSLKGHLGGKRLRLQTDNTTVVAYLENGGGSLADLNLIVKEIWAELQLQGAILVSTEWIRGATQNQMADQLSREIDWDDWGLMPDVFQLITTKWHLTIDRFANHQNHKLPRFNSRLLCPNTEAVDCFSQRWEGENNYWLPPFSLIHRVLRQVIEQKAAGVLVIPIWPAQPWWTVLDVITLETIQLGLGSEIFEKGPSGEMEPTRHGDWLFEARWIDGRVTTIWDH